MMTLILFILVFGAVVIAHEFGHFLIAKMNGIHVVEFAVGMGPNIFSFQKGDTKYSLKLFPIGGACMFEGEDGVVERDETTGEAKEQTAGSFLKAGVWARIATVFAGPFFNFILAFVVAFIMVNMTDYIAIRRPVATEVLTGSAAEAAGNAWKDAEEARRSAESRKQQAERLLREAESRRSDAKTRLDSAEANLIDRISDSAALEDRITRLKEQIDGYRQAGEALRTAQEQAKEALDRLHARIEAASAECAKAQQARVCAAARLTEAMEQRGYDDYLRVKEDLMTDEARSVMRSALAEYDAGLRAAADALREAQQELAGLEEPDDAGFEQRQQEIQEETEAYTRKSSGLQAQQDRLTKKYADLQKKWAHFDAGIQEAEDDLAFAKKLRGDSGIGLQRYVLAIMFNQVIGEANRMLEKVHGGRYRLFRTDDKGAGNKRGLELKVHDNRSPEAQGRSVAMLSGGEKFLVSLSLSIGMSTVAQRAGVQIEALFIDEGFGTLDDHSIADAMDILESVRRSSGMIGIISHVQLLESSIPTHLEVQKTGAGSTIVPV